MPLRTRATRERSPSQGPNQEQPNLFRRCLLCCLSCLRGERTVDCRRSSATSGSSLTGAGAALPLLSAAEMRNLAMAALLTDFPGSNGLAVQHLPGNVDYCRAVGHLLEEKTSGDPTGRMFIWLVGAILVRNRMSEITNPEEAVHLAMNVWERGGLKIPEYRNQYKKLLRSIRHTLNLDASRLANSFDGVRAHALKKLPHSHRYDWIVPLGDFLENGLPNDDGGEQFVWCVAYIIHLDKNDPEFFYKTPIREISSLALQAHRAIMTGKMVDPCVSSYEELLGQVQVEELAVASEPLRPLAIKTYGQDPCRIKQREIDIAFPPRASLETHVQETAPGNPSSAMQGLWGL